MQQKLKLNFIELLICDNYKWFIVVNYNKFYNSIKFMQIFDEINLL